MNTTPSPAMFAGRKGTPSTFGTAKVTTAPEKRTLRKFDKGSDHLQVRPFAGLDVLLKGKDA